MSIFIVFVDMMVSNSTQLKQEICAQIFLMLDERMELLQQEILSTKESRDADTKSSAGDKFETGREMMQAELSKAEAQLHKTLQLKNEILNINPSRNCLRAEFGAVVKTNQGNYFIAVALGKINVHNETVIALSLASPLGKMLYNKGVGDSFDFQGKHFSIEDIV